ncbi:MAG: bifunctional YncE family protein/alkaline phosphatase family protein [candidate division KSB1 bacterium]|nr:bifunctional YncE family protein/alkaline phosphatase family protein [candidate division KSB1 bacterium]MDZ7303171.1 bifunctional YncE family protein/alkaline phosphatase family protein [candidate division KSB1 bacterium]MDZ7310150.1 bifunctional YncE family protein/alkaline phosphatase family protein [candidate division KSB1 bacterium]
MKHFKQWLAVVFSLAFFACQPQTARQFFLPPDKNPGRLKDGRILLPNGWMLEPAGEHLELGDLPLGIDLTPDERFAAVTNSGGEQNVFIIDLKTRRITDTLRTGHTWLGVRFFDRGRQLAASGGNRNVVFLFDFANGQATPHDTIKLGEAFPRQRFAGGGIDVGSEGQILFAVNRADSILYAYDLTLKTFRYQIKLPAEPYTCRAHPTRPEVFVSVWGGAQIVVIDRTQEKIVASIATGDHPNDMAFSPDGQRLFVANANLNSVSIIDIVQRRVIETILTALSPDAPPGSTPNGLAISADGKQLFVANADNNYVAVFDITLPGQTRSKGFIPVGWYPTALRALRSSPILLAVNGKGHGGSRANPGGPNPYQRNTDAISEYIARLFKGSLSFIPQPDDQQLRRYSETVYRNSPFVQRRRQDMEESISVNNPIPRKAGGASPIKYVFYIVKENRTYDQVFGDIPEGNGDCKLVLFPEEVTPNHHALAREFVLLDNLYADAEVSADGHEWSMAAYATDFVEKNWPGVYGGKGGTYPAEGSLRIAEPSSGYIWDLCRRAKLSYRSYGEFVGYAVPGRKDTVMTKIESLQGHIATNFPPYDLNIADTTRFRIWQQEFDEFDKNGKLPRFQVIRLPNDHTAGTRKNMPTPRAMVADNDLALGMMIDRISHSRYWKECAIFVVEDDAQNGPDHVDAHRMIGLVIGPYVKRHSVDRHMYSTASVLRTMELILGLPPMTQFDAGALPMYASFTDIPDFTPYTYRPANINLKEMNPDNAYGQLRSEEMNLAVEDAIPDVEFNEIIWKSIRGADSEMPAPVRSAFVRVGNSDDD